MILGSFGVYKRCIIEWCSSFRALRYLKITIAPLMGGIADWPLPGDAALVSKVVPNELLLKRASSAEEGTNTIPN